MTLRCQRHLDRISTKSSLKWVGEKELKKLNLSEPGLFDLGRQNLRKLQRPLSEVAKIPVGDAVGSIAEEFAFSRLLFPEDWASMAKALSGKLVVMVPNPNLLVYGDGSSALKIDALRTLGAEAARRSEQPLSDTILVWTEKGWKELDR